MSADGRRAEVLGEDEVLFVEAVTGLATSNPFLPERIAFERAALGSDYEPLGEVWSQPADPTMGSPNATRIDARVVALVPELRDRFVAHGAPTPFELGLYQDLVLYLLFVRHSASFLALIRQQGEGRRRPTFFTSFRSELEQLLSVPGIAPLGATESAHLFACLFQIRRAFHEIFTHIVGGSMPAARLRAAVWQSVFTHDMRRYRRALFARMGEMTTLVTGPSGTGKELVARAIGRARYVPFDAIAGCFTEDFAGSFHALNLSALSPTLIESELFGHRKGAFTGALSDREGWLEVCGPQGTVFLDEIGDVDPAIQVKLLRVLQTRTFQRLGDTQDRFFAGKIIAATNRDLGAAMEAGTFRDDLYFRLCADIIHTPSLREQLRDTPADLDALLGFLARRIAGDEEAESLALETARYISSYLGPDYPWEGNVRELEQCVRNVLIRGRYEPSRPRARAPVTEAWRRVQDVAMSADELLTFYCTLAYAKTGSFVEAARRLGIDRRTVKAKVDTDLLALMRE